jgi:D-aspartate ligase
VIPHRLEVADRTRPVLVLKLYHQCGLGVVRSLGRLGIPVYGVHDDLAGPVPASRYCRETFEWNLDVEPAERSVAFLLDVGERLGGDALLIPTDDVGSVFVADNADTLANRFCFPDQPPGLAQALYSKKGMYLLCRETGVPTPETLFPESRDEVPGLGGQIGFPVVVKGIDSWRLQQRSGVRMAIANDAAELLARYDELEDPAAPNVMLQEYIPGGEDSVWMFNGYFDGRSDCLVSFTGRKLRQYPAYTGMTSLGVCLANESVERETKEFMRAIGYRGILDIGWRFDARDGRYKLLDVNPRIGATFRLFVGTNGLDVVRAFYLDLTGQPVPRTAQRDGRKWMVENYDVASALRYFRDGKLGLREWARSFRGVEEAAWFARDDSLPFAKMAWRTVLAVARRGTKTALPH